MVPITNDDVCSQLTSRFPAKWYCEDCKERLNMAGKRINNR